jgi:hypothetical protein
MDAGRESLVQSVVPLVPDSLVSGECLGLCLTYSQPLTQSSGKMFHAALYRVKYGLRLIRPVLTFKMHSVIAPCIFAFDGPQPN